MLCIINAYYQGKYSQNIDDMISYSW